MPVQRRKQKEEIKQMKENIGQSFEARIRSLASDGRGITNHPSGRTFFIPGVWPGELVLVKITELKSKVGFADCVEVIEASKERISASCPHHGFEDGKCGGCPWQFMEYEAQLEAKQQRVLMAFDRLDASDKVQPIWPSASPLQYRNRAQLKTDGKSIGYMSPQSNTLAPIQSCEVLTEKNAETLKGLIEKLPNTEWKPKKRNGLTTLDIDESIDAGDVSVNQRLPFIQANSEQNDKMRAWLAERLQKLPQKPSVMAHALELFCGSGNLTRVISEAGFDKVTAVEGVQEAVDSLGALALENVVPLKADLLSKKGIDIVKFRAKDATALILDPPRDGLKFKGTLLDAKGNYKSKIKNIFYISCDLATLTRDLEFMLEQKYKIKEIQPLDMFPQTSHIELMVWLAKK